MKQTKFRFNLTTSSSNCSGFSALIFTLIMSIMLSACKGQGGNENTTPPANNTSGQYDLVEYTFGENLSVTPSSITYSVTIFSKTDGIQVLQTNDKFDKISDDTIIWTVNGEPASTFVITSTTMEETVHSAADELRTLQRFVDVGTVYMNKDTKTIIAPQNATCKVINHLPSIDLTTLTGEFFLATGIYNDILEVNCVTGFIIEGNVLPHTNLTHYFARNVGLVFTKGELLFFGEVYVVPVF